MDDLTSTETRILDFEAPWKGSPPEKGAAIRAHLDMKVMEYCLQLAKLIRKPVAVTAHSKTVRTLRLLATIQSTAQNHATHQEPPIDSKS